VYIVGLRLVLEYRQEARLFKTENGELISNTTSVNKPWDSKGFGQRLVLQKFCPETENVLKNGTCPI
jgi:hypothetical protein